VTVNNITPGSITGDQTLCTPFDPPAFGSVAATGSGVITYQWQSNTTGCTGTWANITGATAATYDAPAVTVTTYYRRVATSTLNGVACAANSNCLTVTVNNINPGSLTGYQTLCAPFDPAVFGSVAATGSGVITYQWQSNTTGCGGTFANITGATAATYDAPAVTVTTYYRRVATSTLNGVACAANSNCLTVTVNSVTPGAVAGDQTLCTPFDPAAFTETTPATGAGVLSYQWQSNTTGCGGTFTNIAGATAATYDAPAVSMTTYFRRVTTSTLNGVQCTSNSNCITITANTVNGGTVDNAQTICSGSDPAALSSTTAGTGAGVITYQWQSNTTGCSGTFADITGATAATYDPAALTVTTWYRRVTTSTLNGVACADNSNCVAITVNDVNPGSVDNAQTVCNGTDPDIFTNVTSGTGSGAITYQWQSNTTGCNGTFTNVTGATDATYDPGVTTVTTWYRRITTSTLNGVACSANSNCVAITVNDVDAGSIDNAQTICNGDDPAALSSVTAGTGSGTITYQWESNLTGCNGAFTSITGATDATYDPGASTVTTWYRRITKSSLNGVVCSQNSNCVAITVNDVTPGAVAGDTTVCMVDPNPAAFTETVASTGSGNITYQWQSNTTGCNGTFANIPGATASTYDPGNLPDTTYFRRVTTSTLNGVACNAYSNCITVIVKDCGRPYGTYTQGYYGNTNGKSCDGHWVRTGGGGLMVYLLSTHGGFSVGRPGRSVTISATDASTVNAVMPGGRTPAKLTVAANVPISTATGSVFRTNYITGGKINNNLLSQTIALKFNAMMSGVDSFPIFYNPTGNSMFQTQSVTSSLSNPNCGNFTPVPCTGTNWYIQQNVANYLTNGGTKKAYVADLLDLADDLLGGTKTPGGGVPSYSDVNGVIDVINNAFDGWKFYPGAYNTNVNAGCTAKQTASGSSPIVAKVGEGEIRIFPNPNQGTFMVELPEDFGKATITVTDVTGKVLVTQTNEQSNRLMFNLKDAARGFHLVHIATPTVTYRYKISVQ
jgi:hypothetical protein